MPSSNSLGIRSFDGGDKAAVIDLWHRCGLIRSWNDPELDILRKQAIGAELFIVGIEDGLLVATAMGGYDGHRGWVYYLAVSPDRQRLGFGRMMLENLEKRLKAVGCPKINLQLREDNKQVLKFYESIGYSREAVVSFGKRLIADSST